VLLKNGVIKRNLSRRFKIKTVYGQDDPRCMEEVLERRLAHSIKDSKGGFGELPNLILADGGITQVKAIKNAIKKYNLDIPVFGMVKNDKHRSRALINDSKKEFELSDNAFIFLSGIQEEVHRVAIEYHKKVRDKEITKSELDNIEGIGNKKKIELLKKFGSVKKIKEANEEEIAKIRGINIKLAKKIKESLK